MDYRFYTEELGHHNPLFGWGCKFSNFLLKANPDEPVTTILASPGAFTGLFHWDSRYFTVEELKRLQTIPDCYRIVGGFAQCVKQIGNSVPPQIGRVLGLSIAQQIFNVKAITDIKLMPHWYDIGVSRKAKVDYRRYTKNTATLSETRKLLVAKNRKGSMFCDIVNGFLIEDVRDIDVCQYSVYHVFKDKLLSITVFDGNTTENLKYRIDINVTAKGSNVLHKIVLRSFSKKQESIVPLWKYLEVVINKVFSKQNLIQFFGKHYNSIKYSAKLCYIDKDIEDTPFWKVFSYVSDSRNTKINTSIDKIGSVLGIDTQGMLRELNKLRCLGYRIDNSTNKGKVQDGSILIVYPFLSMSGMEQNKNLEIK